MSRRGLWVVIAAVAAAGCGANTPSSREVIEHAAATVVADHYGHSVGRATCHALAAGWQCVVRLSGGRTVVCSTGDQLQDPRFNCIQRLKQPASTKHRHRPGHHRHPHHHRRHRHHRG